MSGRFADSFWGDKDDGFAVLLARMKQGKNTTQEVLDIIATRISIEEEYSKKIHKLARSITAKVQFFFVFVFVFCFFCFCSYVFILFKEIF